MRCHWDGDELMISFYPHTHSQKHTAEPRRRAAPDLPAPPSTPPFLSDSLLFHPLCSSATSAASTRSFSVLQQPVGSPSSRCALLPRHTSTPCIPCCLAKERHGVISWSHVGKPWSPNLQRLIIFIDQPQPVGMAPILPAGSRQVVGAQEATLRPPAPGWGSHYGQVGGGCTASS